MRINTNAAYDALMARRAARLSPDGYKQQLMEVMDAIQYKMRRIMDANAPDYANTPEYKRLRLEGHVTYKEMQRVGIEISFAE